MQFQQLTHYRNSYLPALLGISKNEADDYSDASKVAIHNLLCARLKAMIRLGERAHWAYDYNTHQALREAHKLESIAVDRLHPIARLQAEANISKNQISSAA